MIIIFCKYFSWCDENYLCLVYNSFYVGIEDYNFENFLKYYFVVQENYNYYHHCSAV